METNFQQSTPVKDRFTSGSFDRLLSEGRIEQKGDSQIVNLVRVVGDGDIIAFDQRKGSAFVHQLIVREIDNPEPNISFTIYSNSELTSMQHHKENTATFNLRGDIMTMTINNVEVTGGLSAELAKGAFALIGVNVDKMIDIVNSAYSK